MQERVSFWNGSTWTSYYDCLRSVTGLETLDETLDKIQLSFYSTNALFERGTKAIVMFENEALTYDANGKPLNHRHMIVESVEEIKLPNEVKYNYVMIEPTAILKDIRMQSLTFTSRNTVKVREFVGGVWTDVTYSTSPYNLLTMIQRIFKVTREKTSVVDNSLTTKINIKEQSLLSATGINLDDNFRENTVYDALFKLGKYFGNQGRVPVLYFSSTGSYEYDLWFERKDGVGLSKLTYSTFIANAKGVVKSRAADLNADTVVSDATNMVSYNIAQGIAQDWYGFAIYDGENQTIGAGSTAKPFLKLPHKITEVIKVRSLQTTFNSIDFDALFTVVPCVKKSEWEIRDDRDDICYYDENTKKIFFGDNLADNVLLYNSSSSATATRLYFNVQYYPVIDAKVSMSKSLTVARETTFNQVDSFIDAGSYGSMLQDYIKTNGNAEITVSKPETSFTNIAKLGQRVIDGSDTYHITSITYKTYANDFEVIYQLNKDATKRNDYVGASQKIREGGINYDNTQVRYSTIKEPIFINFTVTPSGTTYTYKYLKVKNSLFYNLFTDAQKATYKDELVQQTYLRNRSTVTKVGTGAVTLNEYVQMAFASTRVGNSILLNIQFDDNKIAGYKLTPSSPIIQSPVYYADPFAEVQQVTIGFGKYAVVPLDVATNVDDVPFYLSQANRDAMELYAKTYPDLSEADFNTYYASSAIQINAYEWWKDGREIGNISYQMEFFGVDGTVINNELLDKCGFLQRVNYAEALFVIVMNSGVELAQNDIILSADIASLQSAGNPILTNRANYIEYNTVSGVTASNRCVALAKEVSTGVYKPLVFKNGMTFTNITTFGITY